MTEKREKQRKRIYRLQRNKTAGIYFVTLPPDFIAKCGLKTGDYVSVSMDSVMDGVIRIEKMVVG